MIKFYKLVGIITGIAIIAFSLTTCSLEEEKQTITFSLDKKENYSFTVTVEGAKWENFTYDAYRVSSLLMYPTRYYPVTNWKRTSDTIITVTYVNNGYRPTRGTEIKFYWSSVHFNWDASELIVGGKYDYNYKVNPEKSSIVWE